MSKCIIEVGHPKGTPAVWVDAHNPDLTVCDHHKYQYDTAFDIYDIEWAPILRGNVDAHPEWCKCQRVCGGDQ